MNALDRLAAMVKTAGELPGLVKSAREAAGLTRSQFARRLGVNFTLVWRWECGRSVPDPANLERVVKALGGGA